MIKIMIVDDELMAIKTLKVMIEKYINADFEIRYERNIEDAVLTINEFHPDLLLLDVMMPPFTGFDLLKQIQDRAFNVIFTTAYDNYAIQAIKFSALDYLLKPISAEELKSAIEKHINNPKLEIKEKYEHLLKNLETNSAKEFTIAVPTLERTYFVHPQELLRCESDSNYTWFYLKGGEKIIASKTLKSYDGLLIEHDFMRIHRSHLVNKNHIISIDKSDALLLSDGTRLPIARNKKKFIKGRMKGQ